MKWRTIMSFASVIFFLFLPIVFCVHWLVPGRRWQNSVLLAASYVFYGWWDWSFCLLMVGSSLVDYFAGILLDKEADNVRRKRILVTALVINITTLGVFKYFNFFVESLQASLAVAGINVSTWTLSVILPVGISFYTFQTMSYTIDVYFRRLKAARNVIDYLTFVSFFPQLVAGPIERATNLLPQFEKLRSFSPDDARDGCRLILFGLAKKLLIADNLAGTVNAAYDNPVASGGAALFLGTICFAFQIYCDFSAYSDMASGSAKLFGIRLMRNFDYPYFSRSITEFWRRWHISLSTWFRDYIYIPLGGNRVSQGKVYRNLFVVALISGIWHGAAWHFVIWGVLHGLFLVAERAFGVPKEPAQEDAAAATALQKFISALRVVRTFALVCLAWIFFRAETVPQAVTAVTKILAGFLQPGFYSDLFTLLKLSGAVPFLVAFVLVEYLIHHRSWNAAAFVRKPFFVRWSAYTALFWYILLFGAERTETFMYFQF